MEPAGVVVEVIERSEESVLVDVSGEVDELTFRDFQSGLEELVAPATTLRIRMSEVTFMSSRGLTGLLQVRERALGAGGAVTVEKPSNVVRRLLEISGLDTVIDVAD